MCARAGERHHGEIWVADLRSAVGPWDWLRRQLHLAFHAGTRDEVDRLVADVGSSGWTLMFADRHPFAGGDDHYAAYLETSDGFEVELCATTEDT